MAHPRLGAGALPAVVSLQSPPPTEGGRRSQDGRLTTVHPPGVAARHCSRLDHRCQGARATRQGSRHRTSTGNEAPGAHGPQPSCLQPQPPVSTSSSRAAESSRPAAGPGHGPDSGPDRKWAVRHPGDAQDAQIHIWFVGIWGQG